MNKKETIKAISDQAVSYAYAVEEVKQAEESLQVARKKQLEIKGSIASTLLGFNKQLHKSIVVAGGFDDAAWDEYKAQCLPKEFLAGSWLFEITVDEEDDEVSIGVRPAPKDLFLLEYKAGQEEEEISQQE